MASDGDMKLVCKSEFPTYATSESTATCLVSLLAPSMDEDRRAPVSVTLVLDKSGSMAGSKLNLVKATCKFLLQQLGSRDSVSVVSYESQATKDHGLVTVNAQNKDSVAAAIDRINPGSTTNLSGGLFMGLTEQLNAAKNPAPPSAEDWERSANPASTIHSVFLFTDGQANCGVTSVQGINTAMSNMLSAHSQQPQGAAEGNTHSPAPVKVHTFGFGSDHDTDMLQGIAKCANGTYYFIESHENIPETFADALGGLLSVFAQNVELTITPVATNTIKEVHTGLTKHSTGPSTVVALPDVFAEERKDTVVDVALAAVTQDRASDVIQAAVSYINVVSGQMVTKEIVLSVQRAERVLGEGMTADEEVVMHRTRLSVANRLQQAVQLADTGRYDEADSLLAEQEAALNNLVVQELDDDDASMSEGAAAMPASRAMYTALRQDVHRTRRQVQHPQEWGSGGRHWAVQQMVSHANQRSAGSGYASRAMSKARRSSAPAPPMPTIPDVPSMGGSAVRSVAPSTSAGPRKGFFGMMSWNRGKKSAPSTAAAPPPPQIAATYMSQAPPQYSSSSLAMPSGAMHYPRSFGGPSGSAGVAAHAYMPPGSAAGADDSDDGEEVYEAANVYANSRQRGLVEKTKDAVEKK